MFGFSKKTMKEYLARTVAQRQRSGRIATTSILKKEDEQDGGRYPA